VGIGDLIDVLCGCSILGVGHPTVTGGALDADTVLSRERRAAAQATRSGHVVFREDFLLKASDDAGEKVDEGCCLDPREVMTSAFEPDGG
jgi:hypothetical protein